MRATTTFATALAAVAAAVGVAPPALAAGPEEPLTLAATSVGATAATLNGTLNPHAKANAGWFFAYNLGPSCAGGRTTPLQAPAEVEALHVSTPVTGLTPHSHYSFCLVAVSGTGELASGAPRTFATRRLVPEVAGQSAAAIAETTATLQASIDPELQEATCTSVQYVPVTEFEASGWTEAAERFCEPRSLGAGESPVPVSARLTGLVAATRYAYRFVAENGSGQGVGEASTFTTLPLFPIATTGSAVSLAPGLEQVGATVTPNGTLPSSDTSYEFEFGPTPAYGSTTQPVDIGTGNAPLAVTAMLAGLVGGTTYHYRVVAINDSQGPPQASYGEDATFRTPAIAPVLGAPSVSVLSPTTVELTDTLDPGGAPARYELKLGPSSAALAAVAQGSVDEPGTLRFALEGLAGGANYVFRLLVTGADAPEQVLEREGTFTMPATGTSLTPLLPSAPLPAQLATPQIAFPGEQPAGAVLGTSSTHSGNRTKLVRALRECHRRHGRARRACERRARRRYR